MMAKCPPSADCLQGDNNTLLTSRVNIHSRHGNVGGSSRGVGRVGADGIFLIAVALDISRSVKRRCLCMNWEREKKNHLHCINKLRSFPSSSVPLLAHTTLSLQRTIIADISEICSSMWIVWTKQQYRWLQSIWIFRVPPSSGTKSKALTPNTVIIFTLEQSNRVRLVVSSVCQWHSHSKAYEGISLGDLFCRQCAPLRAVSISIPLERWVLSSRRIWPFEKHAYPTPLGNSTEIGFKFAVRGQVSVQEPSLRHSEEGWNGLDCCFR